MVSVLALHAAVSGAQEVIPDFYKEPGLNPNRSYVNQSFSEHIDPFTGALQLHYVDLHVPGNGGFDLSVIRSYNSASVDSENPAAFESLAGVGWTIHFGRVLKKDTGVCNATSISVANNPVVETPDGGRQLLAFTGGTSPLALTTRRWRADCLGAGTGMSVYSPEGVRYDMNHLVNVGTGTATRFAWYTTRITDRNGNTATIEYAAAGSPQISSVVTSDGRSVSFRYADDGSAARRITGITAEGQTYEYAYAAIPGVTGKYQLTRVTRPGGTSWGYDYFGDLGAAAGGHLVSRVTYPEGGTIDYTYGFVHFDAQANPDSRSTVVGRKRTTDGTWSFAYAPGGPGSYDTTTVSTPSGPVVYRHVGPNFSASGTVWMVGLLVSKQTGSLQVETNTWTKQKISSQNNFRPGAFVTKVDAGEVNAPVLATRTIERDGATHATTFSGFDDYGNPTSIVESGPNGGRRTTTLTYFINPSKWIVRQIEDQTVTGGVAVSRGFDASGNLLSSTRDGVVTSYTYDSQGNVISATLPRSLTHTFSAHKRGIAQTERQPEGITLSRVVSDAGNVISERDGEGETTSYGYDDLNRPTSVTPPEGQSISLSYDPAAKTATRGPLTQTTNFDGYGRPESMTISVVTRTYRHDALGRLTFVSNPGASVGTTYAYDMLDRVTSITHPDGTRQTISYGAGTKRVVDERGSAVSYRYRSYGDPAVQFLVGVSAPEASASVSIDRNAKDLVTSVQQDGITRSFAYNTAGYLVSVVNPETGTTTFGRDVAGNMISRVVGTSGKTTYAYDNQNRLSSIAYPGSTPSVTRTYTKTNKLKSVVSSAATRSFVYDGNGNLSSETLTVDGQTFTFGYTFNARDQLGSVTYPRSGRVVTYAPNALGRPTRVSGFASAVNYWPNGQVSRISHLNGVVSTYGQNTRLWPSSFAVAKDAATWVNSSLSYDGTGNLTRVTDSADPGYNRTLSYDAMHRLTGAAGPWGSGSLVYSGAGNITRQTIGASSISYAYDARNRLASISGSRSGSFAYGAHGDITAAPGSTYAYNGVPQLTCVNCGDAARAVSYGYDGLNRRVSVVKGSGPKTYEMFDTQGRLVFQFTGGSSPRWTEFVYLGSKRIGQTDGSQITVCDPMTSACAVETRTVDTHFHNDPYGSPVVSTNEAGAVLWKESYRPYGAKWNNAAGGNANALGFAGSPFDAATGLSLMGARYYDPVLGRFMGVDPVGYQEDNLHSFNRYAYANNNPYKYIDPDGRYAELAFEAFSLAVGMNSLRQNIDAGNYAGAIVDAVGLVGDATLATIPGVPGVLGLGIKGYREAGAQATAAVANPVPSKLARVVPNGIAVKTLGREDASDVFVTAASDIAGMNSRQIAERLAIPGSPRGYQVIEFAAPRSGVASPVRRENEGFIGGGKTAGGAREFVVPNGPIPADATIKRVP